jgi:transcriptional regulator with XRE-family HTH domain
VVFSVKRGKTCLMRNQTQRSGAQLLFAANMRRIRLEKKLTQEKVAEFADLHPNYVSSVERGERNISICNIERIAVALGVGMEALVIAAPTKENS